MEHDGERDSGGQRAEEAEQDLAERHPRVVEKQRAVLPERLGDIARRGDQKVLDVEGVGDQSHWAASSQTPSTSRITATGARYVRARLIPPPPPGCGAPVP